MMDMSYDYLNRLEMEKFPPSLPMLMRMGKALGVDASELLRYDKKFKDVIHHPDDRGHAG